MKYFRISKESGAREEITQEKALDIVLGTYKDCDMTRDMLTIPNRIDCRYSFIETQTDDGKVLMPGLWNMTPEEYCYDDNCMRVEQK